MREATLVEAAAAAAAALSGASTISWARAKSPKPHPPQLGIGVAPTCLVLAAILWTLPKPAEKESKRLSFECSDSFGGGASVRKGPLCLETFEFACIFADTLLGKGNRSPWQGYLGPAEHTPFGLTKLRQRLANRGLHRAQLGGVEPSLIYPLSV